MKIKAFIDGQEGTTGLQIRERLLSHPDVTLLEIDREKRKDASARRTLIGDSDVTFLCLPDGAAVEAVSLADNSEACIIDASTAHRTAPGWAYGFPELSKAHRAAIAGGKRIANPGCHATGFLAGVYPLVAMGFCGREYPFVSHSLTGYSGGGKKMIAAYEGEGRSVDLDSPRQYALSLHHKHLPEMQQVAGLINPPVFQPIVGDYYCGMEVSVPVLPRLMKKKAGRAELMAALEAYYADSPLITVMDIPADGFLPANEMAGKPGLKLYVLGNDEQIDLVSVFDNLDKGASGAAVQNMNIAFGLPETKSLLED
jgi:N-acetyl-gamma-glutamyl-phosphate reductase